MRKTAKVADRFWPKVRKTDGCWEWKAFRHPTGYGCFWLNGKNVLPHRVAFELTRGAIPDGMDLDHLCRNRACVNPDHLEPVTKRENNRRSIAATGRDFGAANRAKTHCPKGHEYDFVNAYVGPTGRRFCRACKPMFQRAYRAKLRTIRGQLGPGADG